MNRKYVTALLCAPVIVLAACSLGDSSGNPPMGTTGVSSVTSVTPTVTTPSPTPSTVTVTETVSPRPTVTAETKVPQPGKCVQDGVDTSGWDIDPDDSGSIYPMFVGPLAPPTPSTGDCFDKLVFTVSTISGVEFSAKYVPVVKKDGQDGPEAEVRDIKGSKFLQLVIKANMLRDEQGNPLYNPADYNLPDAQALILPNGAKFGNLRELRLVTADYEGYTTFGIGVDTMTPFAVEAHSDGGKTQVVVYITRPHR